MEEDGINLRTWWTSNSSMLEMAALNERSITVNMFNEIELEEGTLCSLVVYVWNCHIFPSVPAMLII